MSRFLVFRLLVPFIEGTAFTVLWKSPRWHQSNFWKYSEKNSVATNFLKHWPGTKLTLQRWIQKHEAKCIAHSRCWQCLVIYWLSFRTCLQFKFLDGLLVSIFINLIWYSNTLGPSRVPQFLSTKVMWDDLGRFYSKMLKSTSISSIGICVGFDIPL